MKPIEPLRKRSTNFNKWYLASKDRARRESLTLDFISKHAQKLQHDPEVVATAVAIFKRHLDTRGMLIPNPSGIAFAAHYIAGFMEGQIRSAAEFKNAGGVSGVTLRKYVRDVLDGMGIKHGDSVTDDILGDSATQSNIHTAIAKWQQGKVGE